jgi:nitroreductase
MEVFECIETRRTIRDFDKGDIPLEKLVQILDAGTDAPSAGNTQPWEFIVVTEKNVKENLYNAALGQNHLKQAAVLIVVLANRNRSSLRHGKRGKELYSIQDTAACIQNMLLATHALGLGACWVGAFDESEASSVLGIQDSEIRPVAIIAIGNPGYGEVKRPDRLELDKIVWAEKYGEKPKWILPPQRKHRFSYEPLDQQIGKAREKLDEKMTEMQEKGQDQTEVKEEKPKRRSFLDFFRRPAEKKT